VSSSSSSGFFTNFGKTRRQGLEAAVERLEGKFSWALNYSLIDATYQSSAALFPKRTALPTRTATSRFRPATAYPEFRAIT